VSPVFGGNTAQAEFEALCGAPALARFSSIEFNLFSGANAHCLPDTLARAGYLTIASNAFRPDFFNERKAYRGIGFGQSHFPNQYYTGQTYLSNDSGDTFMFDGDLLKQNLAFIRKRLREGRPLFNYVLGIYGHHPHTLENDREPVVEVRSKNAQAAGPLLTNAINQTYYRTQALADYLDELITLDPDAIVIVFGDHLPLLDHGVDTYRRLGYLGDGAYTRVRGYLFDRGKPQPFHKLHQYDIPRLILAWLLGKPFDPAGRSAAQLEKDYLSIMANAMGD